MKNLERVQCPLHFRHVQVLPYRFPGQRCLTNVCALRLTDL